MGFYVSDKEKRKVRDFGIWIRSVETQQTLDLFFLKLEEKADVTLKKFLLTEQYLMGRLEKAEFKRVRKQIRQEEGAAADNIFNYMDIEIIRKKIPIPKNSEENKQLYNFLCTTFYTIAFRGAMQDMMQNTINYFQIQRSYIEKTLYNMDLFQRINDVL